MRRTLFLLLLGAIVVSNLHAEGAKPRIRAVTAFIEVDQQNYASRIQDAQKFLSVAKEALNKAGFEGAGGRITTQPFPQYTKGMKTEEAVAFISKLRDEASKQRSGLNIGAAMVHDNDDTAPVSLLVDILSKVSVNANLITADDQGIHWNAIRQAAKVIKQLSERSPHGDANFNFGAIAMMKPYGPYYPGSYHLGKGHAFAIAMEGAEVVGDVFRQYHDPSEAEKHLSEVLSTYTKQVEATAMQIAKATGWTYEGIDATPAPLGDRSIATAIEAFTGAPFGSVGTETASGIITRAVQSTPIKRTGYSGLMIPVMEDNGLARRWAEGTFTLDSILAYSAVCAGGVDTVPLPGDVTEEQIQRILGDVAWLAYRWNKPLAARLLPAPGKRAGEQTEFGGTILTRTIIQPLPGSGRPKTAGTSRWWSHVEALANDGMEGRNTGSPAHKRAAEYVADQFKKAGLEPAGIGYIQPVAFKTRRIIEEQSSLAIVRNGKEEPLSLGEDANISMRVDPAPAIEAPLVFVGYGLNIPERGMNDLAGLNLKGAIVVYIAAMPKSLPGPLQAHFGTAAERWKMYQAAGAIGTIGIANPKTSDIPWERSTLARLQPSMSLVDSSLDDAPGQQLAVTMNPAHADKLFAGTGHSFSELLALVDADKTLPVFALAARLKARTKVERDEVESQNVAGILRGSDPNKRSEYVVLSAHLDHLGVGEPINGDRIYNGAMDNASGVAAILEVAARLRESNARPARSILFLAVTGEEKGELGSRYFAAHPTVPRASIVANVNTDMFLPLFPLKTLMVLGLDESDLGGDIRTTARELDLAVQADPEPQRNRFTRSDQYSFIKFGIPALAMKVGYEPNSPEAAIAAKWTAERYHAPSDDLNQPVDFPAAEKYVDVVRDLAMRIANRPDRPKWNDSSFFKRFAN